MGAIIRGNPTDVRSERLKHKKGRGRFQKFVRQVTRFCASLDHVSLKDVITFPGNGLSVVSVALGTVETIVLLSDCLQTDLRFVRFSCNIREYWRFVRFFGAS